MAAGDIIPWTDPGGTPCCCVEQCFTDLQNEPKPIYSEDSYIPIASSDYVALYAGGVYSADVQVNVESFRESTPLVLPISVFRSTERHTASASGVMLQQTASPDNPCYERYSAAITITREWNAPFGNAGSDTYTTSIKFARSLGTQDGQPRLSMASVYSPSELSTTFDILYLDGFLPQFPVFIALRSGNMTDTVPNPCGDGAAYYPNLPKVSTFLTLVVSGNTYSASEVVSHPCFQNSNFYEQVINGAIFTGFNNLPLAGDVYGNMNVEITFTPSAP